MARQQFGDDSTHMGELDLSPASPPVSLGGTTTPPVGVAVGRIGWTSSVSAATTPCTTKYSHRARLPLRCGWRGRACRRQDSGRLTGRIRAALARARLSRSRRPRTASTCMSWASIKVCCTLAGAPRRYPRSLRCRARANGPRGTNSGVDSPAPPCWRARMAHSRYSPASRFQHLIRHLSQARGRRIGSC